MHIRTKILLASTLLAAVTACSSGPSPSSSSSPNESAAVAERDVSVDFTGSWEMDYGRSDDVDRKLRSIYQELQRQAERRARSGGGDNSRSSSSPQVSSSISAIIPLAKLADFITTSQVLTIEQSKTDIMVDREDTFALSCDFHDDSPEVVTDDLGSELCGWDAHQLIFIVDLPEGTRVNHRLTLAPDGQNLHIATTVSHGRKRSFIVNRVYYKFEPLPPDFECEYTLSRGNVCSRSSS